ncbi:hypothetical protein [Amycolatopsis nigrescens]|uniref:hypothetical protein n=1 Tax=Amycolatopsis nigrescens TaxID=381445 RepID=UPI0012FCAEFF|nr:hypothetical protein [Amycolatopsis nigrescens]
MKRFAATSGLLALTLTAAMTTAQPAGAETAGAEHCALNSASGEQACFATFTEAVTYASHGRFTAAGDVIQGTFFDNRDYGGDSLTIWGPKPCVKDGKVNWQHDLEDGWKNRISSAQAWGNCWLWLYPEPNLGGERDGPFKENAAWVGEMLDDRTQSIGFS